MQFLQLFEQNSPHFKHRQRVSMDVDVVGWDNDLTFHFLEVSALVWHNSVAIACHATEEPVVGNAACDVIVMRPRRRPRVQERGQNR